MVVCENEWQVPDLLVIEPSGESLPSEVFRIGRAGGAMVKVDVLAK